MPLMCEHTNTNNSNSKDSSSTSKEDNSFASSSASSVSSTSPSNNKKQQSPTNNNKRTYTHNPYAMVVSNNNNNNINNNKNIIIASSTNNNVNNDTTQQHQGSLSLANINKSPAEIELQRGLDTMLITPDAAQNFHDNNNTLHRSLIGKVSFVPYPTEAVEFDYDYYELNKPNHQLSRVFIGQLPYRVTEMQLQWIFYVFGHGTRIQDPERITKKAKTVGNARVPTGCIHCHIREDKVKRVLECMHKRLLIDDSGIWYARSGQEQDNLEAYILKLKKNPELRFPDRPYDTMVVQEAVSSYQSSQPRWVSNAPEAEKFAETTPSRKAQILFLQQQKMLKMQQQQQQYNNTNCNNLYSPAASCSSSSGIAIIAANQQQQHNNNSFHSSTSSHPNSEESSYNAAASFNNNYNNHQQQIYYNNNNNYHYHQTQQQQQQPMQPVMMMNNNYYYHGNKNQTYQR